MLSSIHYFVRMHNVVFIFQQKKMVRSSYEAVILGMHIRTRHHGKHLTVDMYYKISPGNPKRLVKNVYKCPQ